MLFGNLIEMLIGLAMTFAIMSLVTSAATEALASALKWRSGTLLTGLKDLLNDPKLNGLAGALLTHAAINPRSPGPTAGMAAVAHPLKGGAGSTMAAGAAPVSMPSYINSKQFASALVDILQNPAPGATMTLDAAISGMTLNPQIQMLLRGIYDRANGDISAFRTEIATWFDNAMDRVSGEYKRYTLYWNFFISLGLAMLLNVSAVRIAVTVWRHGDVSALLPKLDAHTSPIDALNSLPQDFPIGWAGAFAGVAGHSIVLLGLGMVSGWLITAVATLFGAPFWFDALSNITRLRGTGGTPPSLGSTTP